MSPMYFSRKAASTDMQRGLLVSLSDVDQRSYHGCCHRGGWGMRPSPPPVRNSGERPSEIAVIKVFFKEYSPKLSDFPIFPQQSGRNPRRNRNLGVCSFDLPESPPPVGIRLPSRNFVVTPLGHIFKVISCVFPCVSVSARKTGWRLK